MLNNNSNKINNEIYLSFINCIYIKRNFSQTAIIKGTVVEEGTGKPIPGVLVKVVNTKLATQTDASGEFIIRNVPIGKQELQFSDFTLETKIISDVDAIKTKLLR